MLMVWCRCVQARSTVPVCSTIFAAYLQFKGARLRTLSVAVTTKSILAAYSVRMQSFLVALVSRIECRQ